MECTQRLECTQDFNPVPESFSQRSGPEQIGLLGICGNTYAVNLGPNKIGRDPQTCSIVLDMKSLSRQHAVINVLNSKEYMLMDLGSINKTKLGLNTLQPYIPYPLRNGDTVQFGDVFGMFRQLEDDADLPMTQAMTQAATQDITVPDTPISSQNLPKKGYLACTTIPESPDVSDKDDSFIGSSQQPKDHEFKSPKSHFIKPAPRNVVKLSLGSNKINNVFWNSAQRSPSLNDSSESLNDSMTSVTTVKTAIKINESDIHEMETQAPYGHDETADSIYTANTQLPPQGSSLSIHSLDTQIPTDHLPTVYKVHDQHEMEMELSVENKENDLSIYNKNTQAFVHDELFESDTQQVNIKNAEKSIHDVNTEVVFKNDSEESTQEENTQFVPIESIHDKNTQFVANEDSEECIHEEKTQCMVDEKSETHEELSLLKVNETKKYNEDLAKIAAGVLSDSDEETLFEEFEDNDFKTEEREGEKNTKQVTAAPFTSGKDEAQNTESDEEILFDDVEGNDFDHSDSQPIVFGAISPRNSSDRNTEPQSASSSSPVIGVKRHTKRIVSTSSTESEDIALLPTQCIQKRDTPENSTIKNADTKTQKSNTNVPNITVPESEFEDMATQIIVEEKENEPFDEMLTQILEDDNVPANDTTRKSNDDCFEEMPTQIIESDLRENSINKDTQLLFTEEIISPFKVPNISPRKYKKKDSKADTPIKNVSTKSAIQNKPSTSKKDENNERYYEATQELLDDLCSQRIEDDELVPCSVEEVDFGDRFRHIENELSPTKKTLIPDKSSESDVEGNVERYVAGLTANEIKDVVGVNVMPVALLAKKSSSDMSDIEVTPKKFRPLKFMNIELPDSQEIKTKITMNTISVKTDSSSESEPEAESQDLTPILFKKKKRQKISAKIDLTSKFEADALPTRVITRVRKPTAKMQDTDAAKKIFKPKFLTDHIDTDIITENITRLKNKNDKKIEANKKRNAQNNKSAENKVSEVKYCIESNMGSESKDTVHIDLVSLDKNNKKAVGKALPDSDITLDKKNNISGIKATRQTKLTDFNNTERNDNKIVETRSKLRIKDGIKSENKDEEKTKVSLDSKETSEISSKKPKIEKQTRSKENKKSTGKKPNSDTKTNTKAINSKPIIKIKLKNDDIEQIINIDSEPEEKPVESSRSTRSTRRQQGKTSKSPEKSRAPADNLSNHKRRISSPLPETDVRRSKRQRSSKDKTDSQTDSQTTEKPKRSSKSQSESQNDSQDIKTRSSSRINKDAPKESKSSLPNDQSTIYNISAESNPTPSPGLKRPATEIRGPSPKRTRSAKVSNPRSTPAKGATTQHVLFTAFPSANAEVRAKLENLGAIIVSDITQCTVLVTLQIKRTFKLLCAVGLGRPIVGADWVQACADTNTIVDPWLYLMRDQSAEKRFQFNLRETLLGKRGFLRGWNVSSTPSVTPAPAEMKLIVESSSGTWKEGGRRWLCVSHAGDRALWAALRRRGAELVTTELILGGVLRQVLDVEGNKLG